MTNPYKVHNPNFWMDKSPDWEIRLYGEATNGKGDLGSNTCKKIILDGDKTTWAYYALGECQKLLLMEFRWPNSMNQDIDSVSRIEWRWNQIVWKKLIMDDRAHLTWFGLWCEEVGLQNYVKFRVQFRLTRDPYVAFYTACMVLDVPSLIGATPPVGYVYRPAFWAWYKYLETRDEKYLKRYRFWSWFSFSQKDYVIRLRNSRELAISIAQQS